MSSRSVSSTFSSRSGRTGWSASRVFFIVSLLLLALGMSSCSGCGQETPEQTAERVRVALQEAGYSGIRVAVGDDGVPVLSGTVASDDQKAAIGRLVQGLENIPSVTNNIQVVVPEPVITEEERMAQEKAAACRAAVSSASSGNVLFATNSAQLDRAARTLVESVATAAKASCDAVALVVSGHADPRGDDSLNQGLSDRRAQAVTRVLVSKGIDQASVTTAGYGESRSLSGGKDPASMTDAELQKDRRVEIAVGG